LQIPAAFSILFFYEGGKVRNSEPLKIFIYSFTFGYLTHTPTFAENLEEVVPMFWTLELASHLEDAPWPATKDELIDYAIRSGAPIEVVENLQELEEDGEIYESLEDIWPDYPSQDDFFFNEDEY
jgi:hypothetical protein